MKKTINPPLARTLIRKRRHTASRPTPKLSGHRSGVENGEVIVQTQFVGIGFNVTAGNSQDQLEQFPAGFFKVFLSSGNLFGVAAKASPFSRTRSPGLNTSTICDCPDLAMELRIFSTTLASTPFLLPGLGLAVMPQGHRSHQHRGQSRGMVAIVKRKVG